MRALLWILPTISPFPPRPVHHPVMLQDWQSLTFVHWRYEPETIRRLLPRSINLDTFDGFAWIGLTPFLLTGLRLPFAPALPWISHFPETNVRTYVRGPDGERGIWFFTLEADRAAAVLGARLSYHLPYRWADMDVVMTEGRVQYRSVRRWPFGAGHTDIAVSPGGPLLPGEFDNFLTARYRLYTIAFRRLAFAQIEHEPWPLRQAKLIGFEQDLIQQSGVPAPSGEPVVHHSPYVAVRIGRLQRCR